MAQAVSSAAPPRNKLDRHVYDNYRYVLNKTNRQTGTQYLVCYKNGIGGCMARGILKGEVFTAKGIHVCGGVGETARKKEVFRDALRSHTENTQETARSTFDDVSRNPIHREARLEEPFPGISRSMYRWKANKHKIVGGAYVTSLSDLHEFMTSTVPREILQYDVGTEEKQTLTTELIETPHGPAVAICNLALLAQCTGATHIHVDATFKVFPRLEKKKKSKRPYQLLVILARMYNHVFPIAWVLMQSRKTAAYVAVFKKVMAPFKNYRGIFVTDFEVAIRKSLRAVFPNAKVNGCLFHFSQALHRRARSEGILQAFRKHPAARIVLRKVLALALLPPEDVKPAFEEICSSLDEEMRDLYAGFFEYFRSYWLENRGPAEFCVYKHFIRTNNVAEANNSRLSQKLPRRPSCATFITKIVQVARVSHQDFLSARLGKVVTSRRVRFMIKSHLLKQLWAEYEMDMIDRDYFLVRGSVLIERYPRLFHCWETTTTLSDEADSDWASSASESDDDVWTRLEDFEEEDDNEENDDEQLEENNEELEQVHEQECEQFAANAREREEFPSDEAHSDSASSASESVDDVLTRLEDFEKEDDNEENDDEQLEGINEELEEVEQLHVEIENKEREELPAGQEVGERDADSVAGTEASTHDFEEVYEEVEIIEIIEEIEVFGDASDVTENHPTSVDSESAAVAVSAAERCPSHLHDKLMKRPPKGIRKYEVERNSRYRPYIPVRIASNAVPE